MSQGQDPFTGAKLKTYYKGGTERKASLVLQISAKHINAHPNNFAHFSRALEDYCDKYGLHPTLAQIAYKDIEHRGAISHRKEPNDEAIRKAARTYPDDVVEFTYEFSPSYASFQQLVRESVQHKISTMRGDLDKDCIGPLGFSNHEIAYLQKLDDEALRNMRFIKSGIQAIRGLNPNSGRGQMDDGKVEDYNNRLVKKIEEAVKNIPIPRVPAVCE